MDRNKTANTGLLPGHGDSRKAGSILLIAIIFGAVLGTMVATLLLYGSTEMRLNRSNNIHMEARGAAESMVEYGFAELKKRWLTQTSFAADELQSTPLVIPDSAESFFEGTNVAFEDLKLTGGTVPEGVWMVVDPNDPANVNDPQKGKRVFARNVSLYGKGVVSDSKLGTRAAYCTQTLSVRDAPLFSHAVFYNMDLEFHPGPKMEMQGPVHSNGDIYIQSMNGLWFHSTLMAAGKLFYGYKAQNGSVTQNNDVYVKDADGAWRDFKRGIHYLDSNWKHWFEDSQERWGGNVGTGETGVSILQMIGMSNYVPATGGEEKQNPAYALIEPQVAKTDPNYKGEAVQLEQFSYKAGLTLRVERVVDAESASGYSYTFSAFKFDRTSQHDPKSPPRFHQGRPRTQNVPLDRVPQTMDGRELLTAQIYEAGDDGHPIRGFYDGRQKTAMDVIELDIGLLAEIINNGEEIPGNATPWKGHFKLNPGNPIDWNGVVYVEMPFDGSESDRQDKVMVGAPNVALRLVNGKEVPNPDFNKSAGHDPGFTLATNGQLYVKGHFNADGLVSTGSSTETDDGKTDGSTEAAVALYADAITILSDNFDDKRSKYDKNNKGGKASFTEVSAALVTGLAPTKPGDKNHISGGAHNLPRFLEDWGGVEFRYRGSLVALYESEIGTRPVDEAHSWYDAPNRNWGFSRLFAAGIYPPGTPSVRDFRRTNFRYLTADEYEAGLAAISGTE